MSFAERVFWAAPTPLRTFLMGVRARQLEGWRHGPQYERVLAEAAAHADWDAEEFLAYQDRELRDLVGHAAAHVPFYRERFRAAGLDPATFGGLADLTRLPITEKEDLRARGRSMLDERLDPAKLRVIPTSGTTGTPVEIFRGEREEAAAFGWWDARARSVAGLRRRVHRAVTMGGHMVVDPRRTRPPFWVENRPWKQLYVSIHHLHPRENMAATVEAIRRFRPEFLEGYPASIHVLATYITSEGLDPIPVRACFTMAEGLFDHQRASIRAAFDCPALEQYGSKEQVAFAAECLQGRLHLSPEVGIVEVLDEDDRPVPVGERGALVCTSLVERVQPFLRYRVGDVGALSPDPCPCGSNLPVLDRVEGRINGTIRTPDGRRLTWLGPIFFRLEGIVESQVVQDGPRSFRVRLVTDAAYTDAIGAEVAQRLARRLGDVEITLERVDRIERTPAGKLIPVVSSLPDPRASG